MLHVGTKLRLKETITDIFEVTGVYPGGQGNHKQTSYQVIINGNSYILTEDMINYLFYNAEKKIVFVIEPVKETLEEPVKSEIVEPVKPEIEESVQEGIKRGRPPKAKG